LNRGITHCPTCLPSATGAILQLSMGLLIVKVAHGLAAVALPGLGTEPATKEYKSLQVAFNDVARTLAGNNRTDHVRVQDLLTLARIPSVNEMVVTAVAMDAWQAFVSSDGGDSRRNPVGAMIFDGDRAARPTRSAAAGQVKIPLRGSNVFVTHAATVCNTCLELRSAKTKKAAKKAALMLARNAPQ
jgi:hypothetical protein